MKPTRIALRLAFAATALVAASANAAWTFNTIPDNQALTSGTQAYNGFYNATVNGNAGETQSVTVSGVTATNNSSGVVNGNWGANALASYSGGLGMYSPNEANAPQHALDNSAGYTEGVLMKFSGSVALTSIGVGWLTNLSTDSTGCTTCYVDVSVFRWTGVGTTPTGLGTTAASGTGNTPVNTGVAASSTGSVASGWELVGNYGNVKGDTTVPYNLVNHSTGTTNAANASALSKGSSWWLVTAYNSGFTQSTGTENILQSGQSVTTFTRSATTDYFKLYGVTASTCTNQNASTGLCGTTTKVPEPATLALASAALIGVAGLRRRKAKIAA